jgi:hypothetical protein
MNRCVDTMACLSTCTLANPQTFSRKYTKQRLKESESERARAEENAQRLEAENKRLTNERQSMEIMLENYKKVPFVCAWPCVCVCEQ